MEIRIVLQPNGEVQVTATTDNEMILRGMLAVGKRLVLKQLREKGKKPALAIPAGPIPNLRG